MWKDAETCVGSKDPRSEVDNSSARAVRPMATAYMPDDEQIEEVVGGEAGTGFQADTADVVLAASSRDSRTPRPPEASEKCGPGLCFLHGVVVIWHEGWPSTATRSKPCRLRGR